MYSHDKESNTSLKTPRKIFASDNNSGAHPLAIEAISKVNVGLAKSYGNDPWTHEATTLLRQTFGQTTRPWFVFLGTAANVLGLKSIIKSHHGVICAESAHINTDECGSPEAIIGCKLLPVPSMQGKVCLEDCAKYLAQREEVHSSYPKVLSITQLTECGTAYTVQELKEISQFCRDNQLYLHMDGARLANAAAHLGVSLKAITADVGVDVLSFGGTKNGLLFGEAIVFFNEELGHDFAYLRKQHMQLGSKMRYVAAQFTEYLTNDMWLTNALQANRTATMLADGIANLSHVHIDFPVHGNAVFARMAPEVIAALDERFYFYVVSKTPHPDLPKDWHLVRLMTSFNTAESDVAELITAIQALGK